ncbi:MAG: DUF58 domain-containing protein [Spirochaetia bacterium]|nr:DUF58 domain-containing protein [Spirochaetia bacterium]
MNLIRALCALAVSALCALGIFIQDGRLVALALPAAAWLILGEAGRPELPALRVTRVLDPPLPDEGQPCTVTVTAGNEGGRVELLTLVDLLPKGVAVAEGSPVWTGHLDAGASVAYSYVITIKRGDYRFTALRASSQSPLWGSERSADFPCETRVWIAPAIMAPPQIKAGPESVRPFSGVSGAKRPGQGSEFFGTREYQAGDRLRSINWRAGALWGQDIVNVYEGERAIDAGIILDCRAEAYQSLDQFDDACRAALSCAEGFLDGGNRVAFLRYGAELHWTTPGAGRVQRLKLRASCAAAELGDHAVFERFDHLPINVFPPRSLVILVSPGLRDDLPALRSMRALGYTVALIAILPRQDDQSKDDAQGALAGRIEDLEREVFMTRLVRSGISTLPWNPDRPLSQLRQYGGSR